MAGDVGRRGMTLHCVCGKRKASALAGLGCTRGEQPRRIVPPGRDLWTVGNGGDDVTANARYRTEAFIPRVVLHGRWEVCGRYL